MISIDRKKLHIIIFSLIFALMNSFGVIFVSVSHKNIKVFDFPLFILVSLILFVLSFFIIFFLQNILRNVNINYDKRIIKSDRVYYIVILLSLIIPYCYFLKEFFPGLSCWDIPSQLKEGQPNFPYNEHHPLLHTLYVQFFYYILGGKILKNHTLGYGIGSFLQMMFVLVSITNVHYLLRKLNINVILRVLYYIFTILHLGIYTHSIYATKDIICTCFVVNFVIMVIVETINKYRFYNKKFYYISYIINVIGMILFRSNYKFQFVYILIILFLFARSDVYFKKLFKYTLIGFIISLVILISLRYGLKSTSGPLGAMKESLSIPIQQIGLAYNKNIDKFTDEEKAYIKTIIPQIESYNSYSVDPIKFTVVLKGKGNLVKFISLWTKLFIKYPSEFISAPILTLLPYLYIFDDYGNGMLYDDSSSNNGKWFDARIDLNDLKNKSNIYKSLYPSNSPVRDFTIKFLHDREYKKNIILNIIYSQSLYFYIFLYIILDIIINRKKKYYFLMNFMLTILFVLLISPIALFRYIFPLAIFDLPILYIINKCN